MMKPKPEEAKSAPSSRSNAPRKLDQIEQLIGRPGGASITELMKATGSQQHSVRGALAGALKKRGQQNRPFSAP